MISLIQLGLLALTIILAIPAGFILARVTREELKDGRGAFKTLVLGCIGIAIFSLLYDFNIENKLFLLFSASFIGIFSFISLKQSFHLPKR